MRITTKGRYGLRAVINLAMAHHNRPISISSIATEEKVSSEFLEQIFFKLKKAGLIGAIGSGINELGMIPRLLDLMDLDFFLVALPYTLLAQNVLDAEFPRCAAAGIGFVIGGVFASGILATGAVPGAKVNYADATPEAMEKVRRIEAVCARHKVPLPAAALQFPLGHPSVASVIPGALTPDQVRRNVAAFRHPIPADLWAELKHEGLLRADAPTP